MCRMVQMLPGSAEMEMMKELRNTSAEGVGVSQKPWVASDWKSVTSHTVLVSLWAE